MGIDTFEVIEPAATKRKALNGSRVLVLGVAYKKNVDDMRESPSAVIMELIQQRGGEVAYSDPHVPAFPPMRRHSFDLRSVALAPENLAAFDAVVVATNHDAFDYALVREHARLIVDTRGVYREGAGHIVRA